MTAYRVISADDHIDLRWLPKDLWTKRLPSKLKKRAPRVVDTDGGPYWVCDGKQMGPWGAYTAAQGSGNKWALEVAGVMEEGVLRPTTPELRLADMDRDGVDATVMYGPTDPFAIEEPELRRECYRAYDDWLIEFSSAKPDRLVGVAQLCHEDPAAARDELERVAKLGIRHVNVLAALSLAGIGPELTRIRIFAVPGLAHNVHRVAIQGEFGRLTVEIENVPSENPRTGKVSYLSAIALLHDLSAPLRVGT